MHPHLTSEQMERLLHDPQARTSSLHLQVCPECVEELNQLASVFADLRESSIHTAAEARRTAIGVPASRRAGFTWAYAAAASIALACAILPFALHRHNEAQQQAKQPKPVVAQPISDDALLNSIQSDLSASVPEAMLPLAATSAKSNANNPRKD